MSIILMNVTFNVALILTTTMRGVIETGFDSMAIPSFDYLDEDLESYRVLTSFVMMFTIEAIFQVAFQFTEKTVETI
jgi:hypothetical protein